MTTAVDRMTQASVPSLALAEPIYRQAGARLTRLRRQIFAALPQGPAEVDGIATLVDEWTPRLGFEVEAEALEVTGSCWSCRGDTYREAAR